MRFRQCKSAAAAVLALSLTVTALTACGKGGSEKQQADKNQTTLSMAWWGNQTRNERTQGALNQYHELNPDVAVEGQFYQWNDYWSKLATSAAGNKLPDLVQMDYSYIGQYSEKGQLLDLTPYIESGALRTGDISDDVLAMGRVGDKTCGIAAGVSATVLLYNKSLLDSIGITVKDNMTLDEFTKISKQVAEKTGYRANLIAHGNYMESWSRAYDIQITEQKMGADSPEDYTEYFQILEDGIRDGWHLPTNLGVDSNAIEQNPLVYGSSVDTMSWCVVDGAALLSAYQSAAPEGVEIGITTLPTPDPVKTNYLKPSMFFSVSAGTQHPDEAVAVLDYLINSADANDILLGERGVPVSLNVAEAISDKLGEEGKTVNDFIVNVLMPNSTPIAPPDPEGSSEVRDLLNQVEEKVGYGEITPEEAAREYFEKGNQIFSAN